MTWSIGGLPLTLNPAQLRDTARTCAAVLLIVVPGYFAYAWCPLNSALASHYGNVETAFLWAAISCVLVSGSVIGKVANLAYEQALGTILGAAIGYAVTFATRLGNGQGAIYCVGAMLLSFLGVAGGLIVKRPTSGKLIPVAYFTVTFGVLSAGEPLPTAMSRTMGIVTGVVVISIVSCIVFPRSSSEQALQSLHAGMAATVTLLDKTWRSLDMGRGPLLPAGPPIQRQATAGKREEALAAGLRAEASAFSDSADGVDDGTELPTIFMPRNGDAAKSAPAVNLQLSDADCGSPPRLSQILVGPLGEDRLAAQRGGRVLNARSLAAASLPPGYSRQASRVFSPEQQQQQQQQQGGGGDGLPSAASGGGFTAEELAEDLRARRELAADIDVACDLNIVAMYRNTALFEEHLVDARSEVYLGRVLKQDWFLPRPGMDWPAGRAPSKDQHLPEQHLHAMKLCVRRTARLSWALHLALDDGLHHKMREVLVQWYPDGILEDLRRESLEVLNNVLATFRAAWDPALSWRGLPDAAVLQRFQERVNLLVSISNSWRSSQISGVPDRRTVTLAAMHARRGDACAAAELVDPQPVPLLSGGPAAADRPGDTGSSAKGVAPPSVRASPRPPLPYPATLLGHTVGSLDATSLLSLMSDEHLKLDPDCYRGEGEPRLFFPNTLEGYYWQARWGNIVFLMHKMSCEIEGLWRAASCVMPLLPGAPKREAGAKGSV